MSPKITETDNSQETVPKERSLIYRERKYYEKTCYKNVKKSKSYAGLVFRPQNHANIYARGGLRGAEGNSSLLTHSAHFLPHEEQNLYFWAMNLLA